MPDFNFLLLHVADHAASAALYSELLGIPTSSRNRISPYCRSATA
jgi:hypothetical protein